MADTVKVWEEKSVKEFFCFVNDINEFEKIIFDNEFIGIYLHDSYEPNGDRKFCLDADCDLFKFSYVYTDSEHSVACFDYRYLGGSRNESFELLINSSFYFSHKDEIISCLKKKAILDINNKIPVIRIPYDVLDDEILSLLEQRHEELKDSFIIFYSIDDNFNPDIDLEERINKLDDIEESKLNDPQNSIGKKSAIELVFGIEFEFDCFALSDEEINNFRYLNKGATIGLTYQVNNNISFRMYLEKILEILRMLNVHGRKYHISLSLPDAIARSMAIEMGFFNFDNIDLNVYGSLLEDSYTKEKLLEEDKQLDELVYDIKNSNLSPYEKYLAVYNKVKKFKRYNEECDYSTNSRTISGILNTNYIVCVGFSELLSVLLYKVGISSCGFSVNVDTSYDSGFTMEEKPIKLGGHRRNLVKIDDDKYGIHGIFVADATWDNNLEGDYYNNSAMTFDRKKEAYRLEQLTDEDLLLDFHNLDEFSKKISFYFKHNSSYNNKETSRISKHEDRVKYAICKLYCKIMDLLSQLDHDKYDELYHKYFKYNELTGAVYKLRHFNVISLMELEAFINMFLHDYANYIIPLSNKEISNDVFLSALGEVKREIDKVDVESVDSVLDDISVKNANRAKQKFPYVYNPEEKRDNYLWAPDESVFLPENRRRH